MLDIYTWTGCLQLSGKYCVKVNLLGGLLLPCGCQSWSMGSLVLSVGYINNIRPQPLQYPSHPARLQYFTPRWYIE